MRKSLLRACFFCVALLATCGPAAARDVLFLANGEQMTGQLIDISDEIVTFRATLSGTTFLHVSEVDSIVSDKAYEVTLLDGSVRRGLFERGDGGPGLAAPGNAFQRIEMAKVADIAEVDLETGPPVSPAASRSIQPKWESGMLWRAGNTDYASPYHRVQLETQQEPYALYGDAFLESWPEEAEGLRFFKINARLGLYPEDRWRPFLEAGLERNLDIGIGARGQATSGTAITLANFRAATLQADIGLNLTIDYYDADYLFEENVLETPRSVWDDEGGRRSLLRGLWGQETSTGDQDVNLALRLRYATPLFERGELEEEIGVYPSLWDFGDLRAEARSRLAVTLTPDIELRLDLSVDYEEEPAFADLEKWRTAIGAGIRLNF